MTATQIRQNVIDELILAIIAAAIGGDGKARLKEDDIRQRVGISHGAFVAARRRLVDSGYLDYTPQGGSLPPIYALPPAAKSAVCQAGATKTTSQKPARAAASATPLIAAIEAMPHVTGDYASVDDWIDAMTTELGDCIDVDDSGDGCYTVYSHQYTQTDAYTVTEHDCGGVTVE